MERKNRTFLKNIGIFTLGSMGSKLLSFLLVPLYTAILSTNEYGTVDILITTSSLLVPIISLSIQDAVLRYSLDKAIKKEDVLNTALRIFFIGFSILSILLFLVHWLGLVNISISYCFLLLFFCFAGSLSGIFNLYLRAKDKVNVIAISGIINTLFTCVFNILFLVVFKWGISGYISALIIGEVVLIFAQFWGGRIYEDIRICNFQNLSKSMINYSIPLLPNSLSWWINNASDRYILLFFRGVAENGIYAISYKIPTILTIFQTIFSNAWSISAITEFDREDKDGFIGSNYMRYSSTLVCLCAIIILFTRQLSFLLFNSDEFYLAWKCVPFLLVGTMFSGLSLFEGSLFAATKKTKMVANTTIIGALVNTLFNFLFIKIWGGVGAALATMIGYFTMWLLRTIFLKQIVSMKILWKEVTVSYFLLIVLSIAATLKVFYFLQIIIVACIIGVNWRVIFPILSKIIKFTSLKLNKN